jgi:hypothetical protein
VCYPFQTICYQQANVQLGASKAAAAAFANQILAMEDSLQGTKRLIKLTQERLLSDGLQPPSSSNESPDELLLSLEELQQTASRFEQKIQANMMKLIGKDSATASAIRRALDDDFLGQRLKGRALLVRIRMKVQQSLLAAVPYRRRISRAKKGKLSTLVCCTLAECGCGYGRHYHSKAHGGWHCSPYAWH